MTLQVPGEYVVRLQPLPVPRDLSDLDALRRSAGVRAFVEHARRRTPGYEVPADQAGDLVEVLRRLDGLPLGIELAARQVACRRCAPFASGSTAHSTCRPVETAPKSSGNGRFEPRSARRTSCCHPTSNGCSVRSPVCGRCRPGHRRGPAERPASPWTCSTGWSTRRCSWRTRRPAATGCSSPFAPSFSTRSSASARPSRARALRRTLRGRRRGDPRRMFGADEADGRPAAARRAGQPPVPRATSGTPTHEWPSPWRSTAWSPGATCARSGRGPTNSRKTLPWLNTPAPGHPCGGRRSGAAGRRLRGRRARAREAIALAGRSRRVGSGLERAGGSRALRRVV